MEGFFQVIKEVSGQEAYKTAVGIDGDAAGEKAVLSGNKIIYCTEGFSPSMEQLQGSMDTGLYETTQGRIFVENLGTMKKIILCGGGHVSAAVLAIAKLMEFHITVVEDRVDFAQAAKGAGADKVICEDFGKALSSMETDADTYVIIMTRGHRHDMDCLRELLKKKYAYLGLMGSKARVKKLKEQLLEEGYQLEKVEGLYAPIGLPIGAATPGEIAVSVMAQVIQEKNRKNRQGGYEKEVAAWLFSEEAKKPAVLATIVARKGSAPREVGTKMLVFQDGTSLGTIGGGCMEAEVKNKARHMLANGEIRYQTSFVDMTGRDAQEEGMVCGGTLEIFLEIL